AGALPGNKTAAEYDETVADLVRSGVICDPGMIYFDVRPSAHLPTMELPLCGGRGPAGRAVPRIGDTRGRGRARGPPAGVRSPRAPGGRDLAGGSGRPA